jgi:putative ABC transport system permease protein
VTAVVGIIFASILILMQLGFRSALFDSSVALIKRFNADLVLVSRLSVSTTSLNSFDPARLKSIQAFSEVENTIPLRWDYIRWRYRDSDLNRLAIMIGIDPNIVSITQNDIYSQQHKLLKPNRILFDNLSRPEYGPVSTDFSEDGEAIAFLNTHRVRIAGLVNLGTSFGYDASLLTSIETFNEISNNPRGQIEIGLVQLAPGANVETTLAKIRASLPDDVKLFTIDEFQKFERDFWDTSKPVGFVFAFGAIMGLLVGLIIVYQILYSDVSAHIQEYATMLSMGFTRTSLKLIIAKEALLLCVVSYPLAAASSIGLYGFVRRATNIQMFMPSERVLGTFMLVIGMCIGSAFLAMKRLRDADPTEVFS